MEMSPKVQATELVKQSQKVLILTHIDPDGDSIGSALALSMALNKINKQPEVMFLGKADQTFSFLPTFEQVKTSLQASNDLIITIDTRTTGEELKLGYRKFPEEHRVKIVITPQKGSLSHEEVTVERSLPKYDLIVILDTASEDQLGDLRLNYPDLFYEVPTILIDHHATSTFFAKVNWIEMTATSTAEMLLSLIEALGRDEPLLDADIATALLVGLISDTGSFRNQNTTPKSLTVAAQLIAAGGRHQQIIEAVRSISLSTLKIWGRALSGVAEEAGSRFIWTSISKDDTSKLDASSGEGLIDELLKTVEDADFVLLLKETETEVRGQLRSVNPNFDVSRLAVEFGGGGHKAAAGFQVPGSLDEQKDVIIEKLKTLQRASQKS